MRVVLRGMAGVFGMAVAGMTAGGCGGVIVGADAGDASTGDGGGGGACCTPSSQPGCCMDFGGWSASGMCGATCDGMPTPSTPGWSQQQDSHGCTVWVQPANATSLCGAPPPPPIDAGPPPTCPTPADVSSWTPPAFTPPVVDKGACTSQQIQDLYDKCFSTSSSSQQCQAFQQASASCFGCVLTTPTAPGPLVSLNNGSIVELNVAGCVAITTGDSSAQSCAAKVQANDDCQVAACGAQCPIVDTQSYQLYAQCTQAAEATGCSSYASAQCSLDAGAPASCVDITDFATGYLQYAALFCGP